MNSEAKRRPVVMCLVICVLIALPARAQCSVVDIVDEVEQGLLPLAREQDAPVAREGILDRMRDYGVPGASVAVIENGKLAWAKGYGVTENDGDIAVTSRTLFQAASISKPVTAFGILQLVSEGKLKLDSDVNETLISWRIPDSELTFAQSVTLRHLLSHSAGFLRQGAPSYDRIEPLPSLADVLHGTGSTRTPAVTVELPVGTEFHYSGAGYAVAQQVVEDVTEQPFTEFMHKTVLKPLGMTDSTFSQTLAHDAEVAVGHLGGGRHSLEALQVFIELSAAGLWTTPSDLAQFVVAVQLSAAGMDGAPLEQALANQMLAPQIDSWGLGFQLHGNGDSARFGHEGFNPGFVSKLVAYSRTGQGAIVMVNSNLSYGFIMEVLDSIARAYKWPDYPISGQRTYTRASAELRASLQGEHDLGGEFVVNVTTIGDRLLIEIPDHGVSELYIEPCGTRAFMLGLPIPPLVIDKDQHGRLSLSFE